MLIFELVYARQITIIGSEVLRKEISVMSGLYRKEQVQLIYDNLVSENVRITENIIRRAKEVLCKINKGKQKSKVDISSNESDRIYYEGGQ